MHTFNSVIAYLSPMLALAGTYMLILAWQKQHEIQHTIQNGQSTLGTVIELREKMEKSETGAAITKFAAVVEFQTGNGAYLHYSNTYHYPSRYHIGQKITVFYYIYKSRQEFALAEDTPGPLPGVLLKIGVLCCLVGYPFVFSKILTFF
jgi:Protein of unknown function (DUF3592)